MDNNVKKIGAFVPTTQAWDPALSLRDKPSPEQLRELLVRLYQNINNISVVLNLKTTGYYPLDEFVTGELWYPDPSTITGSSQSNVYRQIYIKVIPFGTLPNNTSASVAHGISFGTKYTLVQAYATANNTARTSMIPIPYASPTLANNISLEVTNTDVVITTGTNRTAYTTTNVVLKFIKQ